MGKSDYLLCEIISTAQFTFVIEMVYFAVVLLVLFILICVWAFHIHISTKYRRKLTDHIPGPYCYPIVGCVGEATTLTPKRKI